MPVGRHSERGVTPEENRCFLCASAAGRIGGGSGFVFADGSQTPEKSGFPLDVALRLNPRGTTSERSRLAPGRLAGRPPFPPWVLRVFDVFAPQLLLVSWGRVSVGS